MPTLGEFELIERFFTRAQTDLAVLNGIGDDAAVVDVDGPLVVAVDTLVGGVHFPPELEARAVGHRALAVNLSDLAAMGARPRWATLALTLPAADAAWIADFAEGFFDLAERFDVALIGGDTTRGPLCITVQVLGVLDGGPALERRGGRVGDGIYVTGTLGDAAAGLAALAGAARACGAAQLIERLAYPEPRVGAGLALAGIAHAAIDVSDGLVADLGHLCRASSCGARVDVECLPLSTSLTESCTRERAYEYALTGGDDYELCFTVAVEDDARVADLARSLATPMSRIGTLTPGHGVACLLHGEPMPLAETGFRHF